MKKTESYIPSNDGVNKLHCITWEPDGEVKGVLQISHGMVEYIERYERFAEFMTEAGYVVLGNDHLGHGKSVKEEDLGYFAEKESSKLLVDDLFLITEQTKRKYAGVPYYVMGHSMGSFLIRQYIMTYGSEVDGVIIMGTGGQPGGVLLFAKSVVKVLKAMKGERYRSKHFEQLTFSGYNKRIKECRTDKDWLTKDEKIVDAYRKDPFCSFVFTLNGFETLFSTISYIQKNKNISKIPKELPVLLVAGEEDPVGNYGKGVKRVYKKYRKQQIKDIELKLYKSDRHELLNETDYLQVSQDILSWIKQKQHNI